MSLAHSASSLNMAGLTPDHAGQDFSASGQPTGGTVTVNDSYTDVNGSQTTTSAQTASGPNYAANSQASVMFTPSNCTYQVDIEYSIITNHTGSPSPNDPGITDTGLTAHIPVPAGLDLSGSVTIDAYVSGPITLPQIEAGFYSLGAMSTWGSAMGQLTGAGGQQPIGTATLTWDLRPTLRKQLCLVPLLAGHKLADAKKALGKANCGVGRLTSETSSKVAKGSVISSNPAVGKILTAGSPVALRVSTGTKKSKSCKVPKLAGMTLGAAKGALRKANCAVGKVKSGKSSTLAKGKVISTSPTKGTKHKAGTKVALTLSTGKS